MKKQRRSIKSEAIELRGKAGRTLSGYGAVFDQLADIGDFQEIIRPGAFARAIKEGQDVRALWNHESSIVLGRVSSGTLRLKEDRRGLHFELDLPDTSAGRDLIESVSRGDITKCSFSFVAAKERWSHDRTPRLREVLDVDLFDVSPVTWEAYSGTSLSLRASTNADLLRRIDRLNAMDRARQNELSRAEWARTLALEEELKRRMDEHNRKYSGHQIRRDHWAQPSR